MQRLPRPALVVFCLALISLTSAPLSAQPPGGPPAGPPSATVTVVCPGDSINAALTNPAEELTIEISGICVEDVVVARDRVTLRGSDPNVDGIQAAESDPEESPRGAALLIRGAHFVSVEKLKLTGAIANGLRVVDSRQFITVADAIIEGNGLSGLVAFDSFVTVTDTTVRDNGGSGVAGARNAGLSCERCTIQDNGGSGVFSDAGSTVLVADSHLDARAVCDQSSDLTLRNTIVDSAGDSLVANKQCTITVRGDTPYPLGGRIVALSKSQIRLQDVDQVSASSSNLVFDDSYLRVRGGSSLLDTFFSLFSSGFVDDLSGMSAVSCGPGSDVFCAEPGNFGGSACASCGVCGDGFVSSGVEQCDDGNTVSGDGCNAFCQLE